MKLQAALTIAMVTFQAQAWSGSIERLSMNSSSIKISELRPVTAFMPIILRQKNSNPTPENPFLAQLNQDDRQVVSNALREYSGFAIKNLMMSQTNFLAEIDFSYGMEAAPQVVFVTGEIQHDDRGALLVVTGYADRDKKQEEWRVRLKSLENILNPQRDFQSPDGQVRTEDIIRARVVGLILNKWVAAMGLSEQRTITAVTLDARN